MSIKISSLKMNNIIEYKKWNGQVQVCTKTDFYWHSGLKSYKKLMLLTFVILTDRLMVLLQTRKFLEFKVRTFYRTSKVQWYRTTGTYKFFMRITGRLSQKLLYYSEQTWSYCSKVQSDQISTVHIILYLLYHFCDAKQCSFSFACHAHVHTVTMKTY